MKIELMKWLILFIGLTVLPNFTNADSLSCSSMINQECKTRPQVVNVNRDEPVFFHLALKQVNVVAALMILTIHMQKFVLLML